MAKSISEKFGMFVRKQREAKGISLRQMAKMIGVSPTYQSQIERGQFAPPAEDKIKAIAEILGLDGDGLLALAGKVSSDLTEIIREDPSAMAVLIRGTQGASEDERAKQFKKYAASKKKKKLADTS